MGIMNFPALLWGFPGRRQQMCRVADMWEPLEPERLDIPAAFGRAIQTVELPTANLPVKWKPPLPVSPNLPKLAPSPMTAKYFGPQLVIKTRKPQQLLAGSVCSATVQEVREDLGLWDDTGNENWDIASGEIVTGTATECEVESVATQRRFTIQRHPHSSEEDVAGQDEFPWYVEEITYGDDRDDYGRVRTHTDAIAMVSRMVRGEHTNLETAQAS